MSKFIDSDHLNFLTTFELATIEEFVRNEMANVSVGICNRIKRDALELKKLRVIADKKYTELTVSDIKFITEEKGKL